MGMKINALNNDLEIVKRVMNPKQMKKIEDNSIKIR